jgi:ATP-dependent DNA helicase RecQ
LPTLGVEKAALEDNDLSDWATPYPESEPELGFQLAKSFKGKISRAATIGFMSVREPFRMDDEFELAAESEVPLFDSPYEEQFLTEWVPRQLGPAATNWFIPQASLDSIFEAFSSTDTGARRVDFLFAYPDAQPLVIEIDGPDHEDDIEIDRQRDDQLTSCGFRVIRIPNAEIEAGNGPSLDSVRQHCGSYVIQAVQSKAENDLANAVRSCSAGSKVQLAVAKAIQYGWLAPDTIWRITISGLNEVAFAAVSDAILLLRSLDKIYGTSISPNYFEVQSDSKRRSYAVSEVGIANVADIVPAGETSDLRVTLDYDHGPVHVVEGESRSDSPDFVIRPAYLPVDLAVESVYTTRRPLSKSTDQKVLLAALETFLKQIFRKRSFWPLQSEAILNPLRCNDSVVLLPTGAGKSIIYQLAGLLMPGVTLVVDPIVSLIEDQVEVLMQYGIDRAAAVRGSITTAADRKRLLRGIERGEYQFVLHSPERLQSSEFRQTLRSLAQSSLVNLAVIDEAHCVSEWGHDFRPAYLDLAQNIREFGKDREGRSPPLLALTGTASRAVLRDLLTELGIDRSQSQSLIRPDSFDRKELHFDVRRTEGVDDVNAVLNGTLRSLPDKFGIPSQEFYRPAGKDTFSGIVFVPFVRGAIGVINTVTEVRSATRAHATIFSGRTPSKNQDRREWEIEKRKNVKQFKDNQAPILVSTKAFGMGIDKPNIRYTIHKGMPGSLESFYQEAGRAGRNRQSAQCIIIFSEYDPNRTDSLLDPSLDLSAVRERHSEKSDKKTKTDDDITRQLFFHLNTFRGQEVEVKDIEDILSEIGDLSEAKTKEIPFAPKEMDEKRQEKAIYRLTKIGVFKGYEVNWGSQFYTIQSAAFDLDRCKETLSDYVESAQPARVKVFRRQLEEVQAASPAANAKQLTQMLIEFTYDVIERSRRRAIQEAMLLARNATDDQEIRQRLLDYLQEGIGAENIERLVEEKEPKLTSWRELFDNVSTPIDAGELRGLSIRSLESFPDHPGLLLTRGVSDMMCSDDNDATSRQDIHAALKNAFGQYDINSDDVNDTLTWITDLTSVKAPKLGLPFAIAFLDAKSEGFLPEKTVHHGDSLLQTIHDDRVQTVFEAMKMVTCAEKLVERSRSVRDVLDELRDEPTLGYSL